MLLYFFLGLWWVVVWNMRNAHGKSIPCTSSLLICGLRLVLSAVDFQYPWFVSLCRSGRNRCLWRLVSALVNLELTKTLHETARKLVETVLLGFVQRLRSLCFDLSHLQGSLDDLLFRVSRIEQHLRPLLNGDDEFLSAMTALHPRVLVQFEVACVRSHRFCSFDQEATTKTWGING